MLLCASVLPVARDAETTVSSVETAVVALAVAPLVAAVSVEEVALVTELVVDVWFEKADCRPDVAAEVRPESMGDTPVKSYRNDVAPNCGETSWKTWP